VPELLIKLIVDDPDIVIATPPVLVMVLVLINEVISPADTFIVIPADVIVQNY